MSMQSDSGMVGESAMNFAYPMPPSTNILDIQPVNPGAVSRFPLCAQW